MCPRDKSPTQPTRLLLPTALALAAVAFSLVPAHDAAAQGFGGRGFSARGGGLNSSSMMRNPGAFQKKLPRPGMGKINTGPGKAGKGKIKGGKIADTGPTHPRPPKRKPPRRPGPGIVIPGTTIPGVVVATPSTGGGGAPPRFIGGGQSPSGQPPARATRSGAHVPSANERRYVPNEVVVEVASSMSAQAVQALALRHRLVRLETVNLQLAGTTVLRWRIPDRRSVPAVVRALGAERVVMSVQPNFLAELQEAPQAEPAAVTPLEQYSLAKLRLPQAHSLATGNKVLIAVIDSGVDAEHPELAGMIVDSFDAIGTGDKVHSHGTGIVGAIVARARLKGAAPAAQILAVRAFGAHRGSNEGTTFAILKGLDWAVARGARIINMSFAGPRDPAVVRSLAAARGQGIVLIAAAGNAGPKSPPLYPAADPNVIAVTATDENDKLFHAANRGRHIAVAAPGVDLLLPALDGEYKMVSGTSFAAAEVSGAVALILERNPGLDPAAVRKTLIATAQDLGPRGADPQFGAGLVDAYSAVLSVAPAPGSHTVGGAPVAERQ
jgi:subtilisin family serine protease